MVSFIRFIQTTWISIAYLGFPNTLDTFCTFYLTFTRTISSWKQAQRYINWRFTLLQYWLLKIVNRPKYKITIISPTQYSQCFGCQIDYQVKEFEDIKLVIRICISKKNRQHNGQTEKVQRSTKHRGWTQVLRKGSISCFTSCTPRVNLVTNPVIGHECTVPK